MTKNWQRIRDEVTTLYRSGKSVTYIQRTLREKGFHAGIRSYRLKFKEWGILKTSDSLGRSAQRGQSHVDTDQLTSRQQNTSASPLDEGPTTSPPTSQRLYEKQVSMLICPETTTDEPDQNISIERSSHRTDAALSSHVDGFQDSSDLESNSADKRSIFYAVRSICPSQVDVRIVESTLEARVIGSTTLLRGDQEAAATAWLALQAGQYKCLNILLEGGALLTKEDMLPWLEQAFACKTATMACRSLLKVVVTQNHDDKRLLLEEACSGLSKNPSAMPLYEGVVRQLLDALSNFQHWSFGHTLARMLHWILRVDELEDAVPLARSQRRQSFMQACELRGGITARWELPTDITICRWSLCSSGIEYLLYHMPASQWAKDVVESLVTSRDHETVMSLADACAFPCSPCDPDKARISELMEIHQRCIARLNIPELQGHLMRLWTHPQRLEYPHASIMMHQKACSEQILKNLYMRSNGSQKAFYELPWFQKYQYLRFSGRILLFRRLVIHHAVPEFDKWSYAYLLLSQYYRIHGTDTEVLTYNAWDWRRYLEQSYMQALLKHLLEGRRTPDSALACDLVLANGRLERKDLLGEEHREKNFIEKPDHWPQVHALVIHVATKLAFEDLLSPDSAMASRMTHLQRLCEMRNILMARTSLAPFGAPDITSNNSAYSHFMGSLLEEVITYKRRDRWKSGEAPRLTPFVDA